MGQPRHRRHDREGGGPTLDHRATHLPLALATTLDLGQGTFGQSSRVGDIRLAGSLVVRGVEHDRSIGYDVAAHRVRYRSGSAKTATTEFDIVQRPLVGAVWVNDLWRVSPRWLVEGGLRAEALRGREWAALSPRISVKYFATPSFALTAAGARVTPFMDSLAGNGALRFFDVWLAIEFADSSRDRLALGRGSGAPHSRCGIRPRRRVCQALRLA